VIVAPLERLHVSQRSSIFRAVLLPPNASGIMWSNSRRSLDPQRTHCPPSRFHTAVRTVDGIVGRSVLQLQRDIAAANLASSCRTFSAMSPNHSSGANFR